LETEGANELPRPDRRSLPRIVLDVAREPMFALLIGAGVIYLLLGDLGEAVILLVFAGVSVTITIVQETRSERVLEALRDLTSPRALVLRNGVRRRIPGREVVRGNVIVLAEGDRVPADAVLTAAQDLRTDESLLTGESVPVRKAVATDSMAGPRHPGGDDLPYVFSGTLVRSGRKQRLPVLPTWLVTPFLSRQLRLMQQQAEPAADMIMVGTFISRHGPRGLVLIASMNRRDGCRNDIPSDIHELLG